MECDAHGPTPPLPDRGEWTALSGPADGAGTEVIQHHTLPAGHMAQHYWQTAVMHCTAMCSVTAALDITSPIAPRPQCRTRVNRHTVQLHTGVDISVPTTTSTVFATGAWSRYGSATGWHRDTCSHTTRSQFQIYQQWDLVIPDRYRSGGIRVPIPDTSVRHTHCQNGSGNLYHAGKYM